MGMDVLVPMDHSPLAERALVEACQTFADAEITVLHVFDFVEQAQAAKLMLGSDERTERAEAVFERAREIASDQGANIETERRLGDQGREIVTYAEVAGADRIVLGSHGRGAVEKLVLGSVAKRDPRVPCSRESRR